MEIQNEMTWNPSVRKAAAVAAPKPVPQPEGERLEEMQCAAAAAIAMLLKRKSAVGNGHTNNRSSAWVIQGRIDMANRWFV